MVIKRKTVKIIVPLVHFRLIWHQVFDGFGERVECEVSLLLDCSPETVVGAVQSVQPAHATIVYIEPGEVNQHDCQTLLVNRDLNLMCLSHIIAFSLKFRFVKASIFLPVIKLAYNVIHKKFKMAAKLDFPNTSHIFVIHSPITEHE